MEARIARSILESLGVAYIVTDAALRVVEVGGRPLLLAQAPGAAVGGAAAALPGDRPGTAAGNGNHGFPLTDLVPELLGAEDALASVLAGTASDYRLELVNRMLATGELVYLDLLVLPRPGASGQLPGLLVVAIDARERGSREQQIRQQNNELKLLRDRLHRQNAELAAANTEMRRMDEMKSMFVSVAAHELRSPLASILAFLELLLDEGVEGLSPDQQSALGMIGSSADRLLRLTNDLLDVTRLEAGGVDIVLQSTELTEVVHAVVAEARPRVERRGLRLVVQVPPDGPAVLCDPPRAVQILGNLLDNAIKYSREGGQITLALRESADPGYAEIVVADEGPGIAPEDQARLFTRFFRAAPAYGEARGAGLGLSIARSLIELHGGRIWLDSRPGQGCAFHVTFPLDEGTADP